LRDNPGGYLDRATKLVDEFLPKNELIVYTEGKNKKYNQKYYSSKHKKITKNQIKQAEFDFFLSF
jgi:C-terminal processing protease CtpA/Prc